MVSNTLKESMFIKPKNIDLILLVSIAALVVFGIIMIFSASAYVAEDKYGNIGFFLVKQLKSSIVGITIFIITMHINYKIYNNKYLVIILNIIIFSLLILTLSSIGVEIKGAKRWIWGFQPGELVKYLIILSLSYTISTYRKYQRDFIRGYLLYLIYLIILIIPLVLQPAFSTTMSALTIGMIILLISDTKLKHFLLSTVAVLFAALIVGWNMSHSNERLHSFIEGIFDMEKTSYQIRRAISALGNGGLTGVGFGGSVLKQSYVPEAHNDFIFAMIGDELGFIGTISLLFVYCIVVYRGYKIAVKAEDYFGYLLAMGITSVIAVYALFIIMINVGLMPPTGLPLPLISYGGTAFALNMGALGILLNISTKRRGFSNELPR